jgi:hypothetical protein
MAEGILKFNLPEEDNEFKLACKGKDFYAAISMFDNALKTYCKYGHNFKDADNALDFVRQELHDDLDSCGINLSELE